MALTPEGKVKAKVKACLECFPGVYSWWPVPAGYGTPSLDLIGCYHGHFFAVETKAPGKKPTPRQRLTIEQMTGAGGAVFVIDGDDGVKLLENWLNAIERNPGERPT